MAKDEELEILGAIVVARADEETGQRPNDQAEEEQHRRILDAALVANPGFRPPRAWATEHDRD